MPPADVQRDITGPQSAPSVKRLADYQPPDYLVDQVELDFALDPAATIVTSRLSMRRNPAGHGGPLRLDGERLELLSVAMDGGSLAGRRLSLHQRRARDRGRAGSVHA